MDVFKKSKMFVLSVLVFLAILAVLVSNLVSIIHNGTAVDEPEISRSETTIGNGEVLNYAIYGDSTAVAQGSDYDYGIAVKTAEMLANEYKVTYQNYGVSGARIADVDMTQIIESDDFAPDLVLVAVGSNDVTHLTTIKNIKSHMQGIIDKLKAKNEKVEIIFTGAASMGDVKRFIQPVRWFMGLQTNDVNKAMNDVAKNNNVTFVDIANKTGDLFSEHPEYFASDNFHPNSAGYLVWANVLNSSIEQALSE